MATEARTVLGPVSTICGSALKIALYIYIQARVCVCVCAAAKWQRFRAEASGKPLVQTPHQLSSIVCIPPVPVRAAGGETPSIYIHSHETKACGAVRHETDASLCAAVGAAQHARLRVDAIGFALAMSCA